MELIIENKSVIDDLKKAFNLHFPFLKIEFFAPGIVRDKHKTSNGYVTLAELGYRVKTGTVSINGHQKVSTFEQKFREEFGINLQVFRKSGRSWLMTTSTDNWTLAAQNKMGAELDQVIKEQADNDFDQYHEQM